MTLRAEAIDLLPVLLRPERNPTGFLKTAEMAEGYEEFCHVVQNVARLCAVGTTGRAAWAFQNTAHMIHIGAHALFEPREMLEYTHEIVHAVHMWRSQGQRLEPILDILCNAAWMAASGSEIVHWLEEINVIELANGCGRLGSAMGISLCLATVVEAIGDGYQLSLQVPLVERLERAVAGEPPSARREALSEALRLARRDRTTLIVNLVKNAFLFAWSITGLVAYRSRVVSGLLGVCAAGLGFWRHWYNGSLDQVRARALAADRLLTNQTTPDDFSGKVGGHH